MTLKPLQTAKYVGVKWSPDHQFTSTVIEPLLASERRQLFKREGRLALKSLGIRDYDGVHVTRAAHFDDEVGKAWLNRDLVQVAVDGIARKSLGEGQGYRLKFHLEEPHASVQRRLIDRMPPSFDALKLKENGNRFHMLESVFLDVPNDFLPDQDEFEKQLGFMRLAIGSQSLKSIGWLNYPEAYVVSYGLNPEDMTTLAERARHTPED